MSETYTVQVVFNSTWHDTCFFLPNEMNTSLRVYSLLHRNEFAEVWLASSFFAGVIII